MTAIFDVKTMQARFHALGAERKAIEDKAKPLRDQYEALVAQSEALKQQMRPVLDLLKTAEGPLFEIDQERSIITRALAGRTGEPG